MLYTPYKYFIKIWYKFEYIIYTSNMSYALSMLFI